MKTSLLTWTGVLRGVVASGAADKIEAGPKGGRILEKTTLKAEFLVEKDKTVSINFYDAAGKPVSPTGQTVTVIADTKERKEKIGTR
ncbi:MAG TPA: hypothetical protein VGF13_17230 [Verrucomicrobiae bacterium]|jgi:hypothetical protein